MNLFLDTDICVFAIRGKYPEIRERITASPPERIKIPSIVKAELLTGASRSHQPTKAHSVVEYFLSPFEIVPFDDASSVIYSQIRHDLEKKGHPIGPNDLLVAATTLAHRGTLVTHNTKEFSRIPDLKLLDWIHNPESMRSNSD